MGRCAAGFALGVHEVVEVHAGLGGHAAGRVEAGHGEPGDILVVLGQGHLGPFGMPGDGRGREGVEVVATAVEAVLVAVEKDVAGDGSAALGVDHFECEEVLLVVHHLEVAGHALGALADEAAHDPEIGVMNLHLADTGVGGDVEAQPHPLDAAGDVERLLHLGVHPLPEEHQGALGDIGACGVVVGGAAGVEPLAGLLHVAHHGDARRGCRRHLLGRADAGERREVHPPQVA